MFCVSLHILLFPVDVNANLDETVNICHFYQKQIMTDAQNEQPKKCCSMVSCIRFRIPITNM